MNQKHAVHADLDLTTVWVDNSAFHDYAEVQKEWVKAKIFGLTCIQGRVPTFEILTTEGYVFSDVPPHSIRWKSNVEKEYPLNSLVYNNCLSDVFSISKFPALSNKKAFAFLKHEAEYVEAQYWFSLDFYEKNNWYHCLKLSNGQLAFLPSHKLVFPESGVLPLGHAFPKYQKLRKEFKV